MSILVEFVSWWSPFLSNSSTSWTVRWIFWKGVSAHCGKCVSFRVSNKHLCTQTGEAASPQRNIKRFRDEVDESRWQWKVSSCRICSDIGHSWADIGLPPFIEIWLDEKRNDHCFENRWPSLSRSLSIGPSQATTAVYRVALNWRHTAKHPITNSKQSLREYLRTQSGAISNDPFSGKNNSRLLWQLH